MMTTEQKATKLAKLHAVPSNVGGWRLMTLTGTETCQGNIGDIRDTYKGRAVCIASGKRPAGYDLPNSHPDYTPGGQSIWAVIPNEPWDARYIDSAALSEIS